MRYYLYCRYSLVSDTCKIGFSSIEYLRHRISNSRSDSLTTDENLIWLKDLGKFKNKYEAEKEELKWHEKFKSSQLIKEKFKMSDEILAVANEMTKEEREMCDDINALSEPGQQSRPEAPPGTFALLDISDDTDNQTWEWRYVHISSIHPRYRHQDITAWCSPKLAGEILKKWNAINRHLDKKHGGKFKKDSENGDIIDGPHGAFFNINGDLIDGQHLLWGIYTSGVGAFIKFSFNYSKKVLFVLGREKKRSAYDIAKMAGKGYEGLEVSVVGLLSSTEGYVPTVIEEPKIEEKYIDVVRSICNIKKEIKNSSGFPENNVIFAAFARALIYAIDNKMGDNKETIVKDILACCREGDFSSLLNKYSLSDKNKKALIGMLNKMRKLQKSSGKNDGHMRSKMFLIISNVLKEILDGKDIENVKSSFKKGKRIFPPLFEEKNKEDTTADSQSEIIENMVFPASQKPEEVKSSISLEPSKEL
jgi:hypothetical protein